MKHSLVSWSNETEHADLGHMTFFFNHLAGMLQNTSVYDVFAAQFLSWPVNSHHFSNTLK